MPQFQSGTMHIQLMHMLYYANKNLKITMFFLAGLDFGSSSSLSFSDFTSFFSFFFFFLSFAFSAFANLSASVCGGFQVLNMTSRDTCRRAANMGVSKVGTKLPTWPEPTMHSFAHPALSHSPWPSATHSFDPCKTLGHCWIKDLETWKFKDFKLPRRCLLHCNTLHANQLCVQLLQSLQWSRDALGKPQAYNMHALYPLKFAYVETLGVGLQSSWAGWTGIQLLLLCCRCFNDQI